MINIEIMNNKTISSIDKDLTLNTKLFILMTFLVLLFSYWMDFNDYTFVFASVLALIVVLAVEYYFVLVNKYPATWHLLKWIFLFILITLITIGFI